MASQVDHDTRPRLLSNSCAEFVENRAGDAIIERVIDNSQENDAKSPVFVPSIDRFVPPDLIPNNEDAYKTSQEKLEEFQVILKDFSQLLQKRKIFKNLEIEIRDPKEYDLNYILSIAMKIQDKREGSENIQVCKRFIRKCFKTVKERSGLIKGVINLAPNDVYGCLISGGFTIILAAVEKHEDMRKEVQKALASIPNKLDRIQRLSAIHIFEKKLHHCADAVFVSILNVLERIIDKISMSFKEKIAALSLFSAKENTVSHAIASLDDHIVEFEREIEVCSFSQIARMEENGKQVKAKLDEMENHLKEWIKEREAIPVSLKAEIFNYLYLFFASHPGFNNIDGTINRDYARVGPPLRKAPAGGNNLIPTKQRVDAWLKELGDFDPSPDGHVTKCLGHSESLELQEMDRIHFIMNSHMLHDWMCQKGFGLLQLKPETPPDDLINCMSFVTAMLTDTLRSSTDCAVLSFFCGLRKNESHEEGDSGLMGILKSLNGQLLNFILEKHPDLDISILDNTKYARRSREKPKDAFIFFKELLCLLPETDVVFIMLESISLVAGDKSKVDDLVEKIAGITKGTPHPVIKLLVTNALPNSCIKTLENLSLQIADDVDGGECGMNFKVMEKTNKMNFQAINWGGLREQSSSEGSGSESDDDW